jgi:hypothetical protein
MPNETLRRAQLGLAISGPFSRNRRRPRQWGNAIPYLLSAAVTIASIGFIAGIFLL